MIDALVRRFLGTAGSSLLDFYIEYNFWINLGLFAYVILVLLARRNYDSVAQLILADFIQQHGDKLSRKSPNEIRVLLSKWTIPWKNGMQTGFPFISSPQGILLRLNSQKTLQKLFPIDVLVETIVKQTPSRSKDSHG